MGNRISANITRTTALPRERVWQAVSDHSDIVNWAPRTDVDLTPATEGDPNGVGAVRRISGLLLPATIVERVTEFTPTERLSYSADAGVPFRNYEATIVLRDRADGGTEIAWSAAADGRFPGDDLLLRGLVFGLQTLLGRRLGALEKAAKTEEKDG